MERHRSSLNLEQHAAKGRIRQGFKTRKNIDFSVEKASVAVPDPYAFGPPGSGSGSFFHQAKLVRKTLLPPIL